MDNHPSSRQALRQAADALIRGATSISLAGCAGAVVVAVLQFAVLCLLVTPQFVGRIDPGYLVYSPIDDFAVVTATAQRMRYDRPELGVLLAGPSTCREAIYDPQQMERDLTAAVQMPVHFYLAASSWQSLWETAAVLDHLPADFRGLVVIGMTPGRLARTDRWLCRLLEHPQLGLTSSSLQDEVLRAGLDPPASTGVYLVDQAPFFAARRRALLRYVSGPLPYQRNRYAGKRSWSPRHWQEFMDTTLVEWGDLFPLASRQNLEVLERIVKRLRNRDIKVVLLEAPLETGRIEELCAEWLPQYYTSLEEFARRESIPLWDLNREVALTPEDFFDWGHLKNPEAQQRYQAALVQRLIPLLVPLTTRRRDAEAEMAQTGFNPVHGQEQQQQHGEQ
jgi:hypothetical protein